MCGEYDQPSVERTTIYGTLKTIGASTGYLFGGLLAQALVGPSGFVHLIRDEMSSGGTAAIIVTHDDWITHYADHPIHLEDGLISA